MSKRSAEEGARGMFMLQPGRLQRGGKARFSPVLFR